MLYRNISSQEWSDALTLTGDAILQVHAGTVVLALNATNAPADLDDGLILRQDVDGPLRDSVELPAGSVVRWRAINPRPTILYIGEK